MSNPTDDERIRRIAVDDEPDLADMLILIWSRLGLIEAKLPSACVSVDRRCPPQRDGIARRSLLFDVR